MAVQKYASLDSVREFFFQTSLKTYTAHTFSISWTTRGVFFASFFFLFFFLSFLAPSEKPNFAENWIFLVGIFEIIVARKKLRKN